MQPQVGYDYHITGYSIYTLYKEMKMSNKLNVKKAQGLISSNSLIEILLLKLIFMNMLSGFNWMKIIYQWWSLKSII